MNQFYYIIYVKCLAIKTKISEDKSAASVAERKIIVVRSVWLLELFHPPHTHTNFKAATLYDLATITHRAMFHLFYDLRLRWQLAAAFDFEAKRCYALCQEGRTGYDVSHFLS